MIDGIIREIIPDDGEYIYGFADLSDLLSSRFKGHDYGIVIGKKLDDSIVDSIIEGPNESYYELYMETNEALSGLIQRVSKALKPEGVSSIPVEPTVPDEQLDREKLLYDFSHKMAATRAGLGWIGKTALLVSKIFGPRLRLATVLIDHPPDNFGPVIDSSRCGDCFLCVKWCPAGAANGLLWEVGLKREAFFNPFRCWEKCLELSEKRIGKKVSICGICISVCPVGRR